MQHLTEEQLVSHYYHDGETPGAQEHLATCAECVAQYDTIRRVLALVDEAPVPERDEQYEVRVWNRLRWKLGSDRRRHGWQSIAAIAAMLAVAFFAGQLWRAGRDTSKPALVASQNKPADARNRVLLVVLSDHLDTSERVLMEVVNADPRRTDLADQQKRADELVSANRMYRRTAIDRGDDRVAALLSDLEPVLIEISHAGSAEKVAQLQKRIESKGLLFKVRVLSAHVTGAEKQSPVNSDTL